jgi:hypothetical protein
LTPRGRGGIIGLLVTTAEAARKFEEARTVSTDLGQTTEQQPGTRADLARQLLARVDRLATRLGDVSLAAEVQLLKRELVRRHAILSDRPEDNNFLSVITLVEAALASLTWKAYTPGVLDGLRRAFSGAVREGEFTFEEYDAIRRQFKSSGIPTAPTIDLPPPDLDGSEDGPQA